MKIDLVYKPLIGKQGTGMINVLEFISNHPELFGNDVGCLPVNLGKHGTDHRGDTLAPVEGGTDKHKNVLS